MDLTQFETGGGVRVSRTAAPFDPALLEGMTRQVEARRGGVLSSGMEYPGRYSRWHLAYVDPCIELVARGRQVTATALNGRGLVLLPVIADAMLRAGEEVPTGRPAAADVTPNVCTVVIPEAGGTFTEEERSRRPTVFSALREIIAAFSGPDPHLGLYGAFGYDLAFQFEPVRQRHARPGRPAGPGPAPARPALRAGPQAGDRDLLQLRVRGGRRLHPRALPGRPRRAIGARVRRAGPLWLLIFPPTRGPAPMRAWWSRPGSASPAATCSRWCRAMSSTGRATRRPPSTSGCGSATRRRTSSSSTWGSREYLVGASPEMYVRVTGDRVETCPIAGTIARGADPLADAENIRTLLTSAKEESELTMCTDVDRNDKSRVCEPGSVRVIGRRQIEIYSRLIHTVDHVEGRLRPGFDALDAFLTHMWAVTVTGAPKTWAMQFIEDHEDGPRRWYGGAVGMIGFDGGMNTGLTLRTAHISGGIASVRAGATLLFESDPAAEERETQLKARALLETLGEPAPQPAPRPRRRTPARRPALACGCCWSITRTRSCTPWPATSARPERR